MRTLLRLLPVVAFLVSLGCDKARTDRRASAAKATGPTQPAPAPAPSPVAPLSAPKPTPPPLDPAQAARMVAAAIEESKKSGANCTGVVTALFRALPVVAPKITPESIPAYVAFAKCLRETKNYRTLLNVAYHLVGADPQHARAGYIPRALVGLGRYEDAAKEIDRLKKLYPGDSGLAAVTGLLYWSTAKWDRLLTTADEVRKLVESGKTPPKPKHVARARLLRAEALYHLGRLEEADREIAELAKVVRDAPPPGAPPAVRRAVEELQRRSANARRTGLGADYLIQTPLPLGAFHLLGEQGVGGPLLRLSLYNFAKEDRALRVEAEIPGVTERVTKTVTLLQGATASVPLSPPLKMGFDVSSVPSPRPVQLAIKFTRLDPGGDRVLYEETYPVTLLPRDALTIKRRIGNDNYKPTYEYIAAWMTPNAKPIDAFLTAAKKRAPRSTFAGEQTGTVAQVKAIYEELQARGVSYVMDPTVLSGIGQVQRTRLPAQVLASTNAQCLEGAILFATLMEAIGLRPLIAIVPGHALVGWHATTADGVAAGAPVFLETTVVHDGRFELAVQLAMKRIAEEKQKGNFERGLAAIIEIAELRRRGITPQPWE